MVELKDGKCIIRGKDNVVATGTLHGALYILDTPQTPRYNEVRMFPLFRFGTNVSPTSIPKVYYTW